MNGFLDEKRYRWVLIVLAIASLLVNIKSIFMDYNYDSGYAAALAYRMVQGDTMFAEMWEPHQTSAFLCVLLIKGYMLLTGSVTGVVLYLQVAGVVLKGLVTGMIYTALKPWVRKDMLFLMCLFFFSVTPKGLPMPEFSNMQIWFSVGLFCCLVRYFHAQNRKLWLLAAGTFLCLEVLAYPSCIIVYVGVVVLLFFYSKNKWKDALLFSGVCFSGGAAYCGYFLARLGAAGFLESISYIITGDGSHDTSFSDKCAAYAWECCEIIGFLAGLALAAYLLLKIISLIVYYSSGRKKTVHARKAWLTSFFLLFLICDLLQALSVKMTYDERLPIYVPILVAAILSLKRCTEEETQIVVTGMLLSFFGFMATLVLTNLTISSTLNYLILAVMVAFLPIVRLIEGVSTGRKKRQRYGLLLLFCAITIFRSGYIMKCMSTEKTNILNAGGVVKEGPAKGLISEYMGPHILNTTMAEWKEYVKPGDKVLIISAGLYDPVQYLFEDVEICAASTICTPTYNEMQLEYWKLHPDKYPDVVIVDCWFGNLRVEENSPIMRWLEQEFRPVSYVDGEYWRYYR